MFCTASRQPPLRGGGKRRAGGTSRGKTKKIIFLLNLSIYEILPEYNSNMKYTPTPLDDASSTLALDGLINERKLPILVQSYCVVTQVLC